MLNLLSAGVVLAALEKASIEVIGLKGIYLLENLYGDTGARPMNDVDILVHLSLHLTYQHHLKLGLRGLYDIALLIHRHKDEIDWPKLAQIARSWQAEKVIALILALASDLLGVAVPQIVTEELLEEIADGAGLVTERQE